MISRTRDTNQNQISSSVDGLNWRTTKQVQSQLYPSIVMSNFPPSSSFEPRFPLPQFSYTLVFEFSRIKRMTNDIALILCSMRSSTNVEIQDGRGGYKLRKRHGWERWLIPREGFIYH
ncbi:unnamed protein product [Arabis nemorensis]|uniref:Uncharacterized protein n=1 Tax=Arabis nemorensis TaxID=586526 RepID=A0A565B1A2_9BRAS|nr:unnamed protein product [Arabis nemorensis]